MIVFKTYFKILKQYKWTVLLYTAILLLFGIFNMQSSQKSMSFSPEKPDISIVNHDSNADLTNHLIQYLQDHCHIVSLDEKQIDDAIFYRDVHYVIYIPENYSQDLLAGKNPILDIQSTGDYQASLAKMLLERYIKIQNTLIHYNDDETEIINQIDKVLENETAIVVDSQLDSTQQSQIAYYFNFASYAIMACIIFIVCLIMTSFKDEWIRKRTVVAPLSYQHYNRQLLLANSLYVIVLWLFYVGVAHILLGGALLNWRGMIYAVNFLIYAICSLTIAMLLSSLLEDKNVISGIANVIALGSAFLSGVFVPASLLPDFVLKIAHVLPSYWFVSANETLKTIEVLDWQSLQPVLTNMLVLIGFVIIFIVFNNILVKKKQRFG